MPIRNCFATAAILIVALCTRVSFGAPTEPVEALRAWLAHPRDQRPDLDSQPFAAQPLNKEQAATARRLLWDDHVAEVQATRGQEWRDQAITLGEHTLRFKQRHFGNKPNDGWSLYLSLHGGGNAPPQLNDQQWENQARLYQPKEGLYVAPRAPTNTWNLWHESHIDDLFDRFLEDAFVLGEVNPNRVFVMGYSAGGDGVYQLAPRMADRFAAASMMAGHPNDASPLGLRNIAFAIHVGALDNGYNRNNVAAEWKQKLDDLQKDDPDGYIHHVELHPGRAHWMNLEDKSAVEWMAKFNRDPLPGKIVWKQSKVTHDRFYWLAVPSGEAKPDVLVVVSRKDQHIEVERAEGVENLIVLLSDSMVDLDRPVVIRSGGHELFNAVAPRTIKSLHDTLASRGDPYLVFDAAVKVALAGQPK